MCTLRVVFRLVLKEHKWQAKAPSLLQSTRMCDLSVASLLYIRPQVGHMNSAAGFSTSAETCDLSQVTYRNKPYIKKKNTQANTVDLTWKA